MLLLEPCVVAVIPCSLGRFMLPLWNRVSSLSYLQGTSQISRWLSTRICKMCPDTSYYWWQWWLGAMSQSEKSKYKVKQWWDSDSPVTKTLAVVLAARAISHPKEESCQQPGSPSCRWGKGVVGAPCLIVTTGAGPHAWEGMSPTMGWGAEPCQK